LPNDYCTIEWIGNQEWWRDPLADFAKPSSIVVVEISEEDLLNENAAGMKEKGAVVFNDWKGLGKIIGNTKSRRHQKDFLDLQPIFRIVFLYTDGRFVTDIIPGEGW